MTVPNEWQGHLRNDRFRELLLTFEPEGKRVVGQYLETGPISMYQNWKIMRAGQGWEVVLLNIGSGLYVQMGDMRLTFGENPTIFYAIEQDGGLVGFQVPKGPTWDLRTGEPGEEIALVNNAGDFTEDQKWSPEPAWN